MTEQNADSVETSGEVGLHMLLVLFRGRESRGREVAGMFGDLNPCPKTMTFWKIFQNLLQG